MNKKNNYNHLELSISNNICMLKINREKHLNALSKELIKELIDFFDWANTSSEIRVVILFGSGEKAFVAGADIKEMSELEYDYKKSKSYAEHGQSLTMKIENLSKPVIAAINGYALGGGCELAMACHIRYAVASAKFGQPEVGLGLIAGFGGTQRLPRLIGKGHAMELLLSGKMITSKEALQIKLVNRVLENKEELIAECIKTAKKIIKNSPIAIKNTIKSINKGEGRNLTDALKDEADMFAKTLSNYNDAKEGLSSFLKKKKPDFSGD